MLISLCNTIGIFPDKTHIIHQPIITSFVRDVLKIHHIGEAGIGLLELFEAECD